jgi:hypothetical protein
VALANELLRQEAIKSSEESMTYLNEELARTSVEPVRQALFRLMEVRINQAMLANVEREYAFRPVDRAEPSETKKFVSPQPLVELLTAIMCGVAVGAIFACWRYRKSALDPKADA